MLFVAARFLFSFGCSVYHAMIGSYLSPKRFYFRYWLVIFLYFVTFYFPVFTFSSTFLATLAEPSRVILASASGRLRVVCMRA